MALYKGPGALIGLVAVLGLMAVFSTMLYKRVYPDTHIPPPQYDQVFKYCLDMYVPASTDTDKIRETAAFKKLAALQPGTYRAGDGGYLYLFKGGMFQIALPMQLQVVRRFDDGVKAVSASQRPRNIIGCRPEQMAAALNTYGLDIGPLLGPIGTTRQKQ